MFVDKPCPVCKAKKYESKVYLYRIDNSDLPILMFTDRMGRQHIHDPYEYRYEYWCVNCHQTVEYVIQECPTCGDDWASPQLKETWVKYTSKSLDRIGENMMEIAQYCSRN